MDLTAPPRSLRFSTPELEAAYWRDAEGARAPVRLLGALAAASMLLFGAIDVYVGSPALPAVLAWRALGIAAPVLLLLVAGRTLRRRELLWVALTLAAMGVSGAGVLRVSDETMRALHHPGVLVLLALGYTGLRLPFRLATAAGLVVSAADLWAARPGEARPAALALEVLFLLVINVVGMVTAHSRERLLRDRFLAHAELVNEHAALLELSERLETLSSRDALTGLFNRRELDKRLTTALVEGARHRTPVTLALVDLDRFKEVNDVLGHAAGDEVLRRVARLILTGVRTDDLVFRYGGDELCVLMPRTRLADGAVVLERVLARLADATALDHVPVGFSAGCAESRPGDGGGELLQRADGRLYAAKRAGRGRVVAADAMAAPPPSPARAAAQPREWPVAV
jgi:diguanylate cyclase (GGDEF)-like protein